MLFRFQQNGKYIIKREENRIEYSSRAHSDRNRLINIYIHQLCDEKRNDDRESLFNLIICMVASSS